MINTVVIAIIYPVKFIRTVNLIISVFEMKRFKEIFIKTGILCIAGPEFLGPVR
jgi:hypothetical protein